jgi:hypothetical protein
MCASGRLGLWYWNVCFLKMQNIVLKTSILETAIISYSHVDVVGSTGCGLDSRRQISDSDWYFSLCFYVTEPLWPVQLSVKSIPCTISLGAKPLGAWVWPVNELRLAVRLLGTAPVAPYVCIVVYVPTDRTVFTWVPCTSRMWCLTRCCWCSGVHWRKLWTLIFGLRKSRRVSWPVERLSALKEGAAVWN